MEEGVQFQPYSQVLTLVNSLFAGCRALRFLFQHEAEYKAILNATKSGASEKRLAAQFIPRFFKFFPQLAEQAIDAQTDLCEDDDVSVSDSSFSDVNLHRVQGGPSTQNVARTFCAHGNFHFADVEVVGDQSGASPIYGPVKMNVMCVTHKERRQFFSGVRGDASGLPINQTFLSPQIRKQAIKDLPVFCKEVKENTGKVVGVLVQLLLCQDAGELSIVHNSLMTLFKTQPKGACARISSGGSCGQRVQHGTEMSIGLTDSSLFKRVVPKGVTTRLV